MQPFANDDRDRRANLEGLAEAAHGALRMAASLVAAGRAVDLDGLQDPVGRVCAGCLDLPPALGRAMRPLLTELVAEIDRLAGLMHAPASS